MGYSKERPRNSRVVRIAKPDKRDIDFNTRAMEKIAQYDRLKSNSCSIAGTWLDSVAEKEPKLANSVAIMRSSLQLLQGDTIGEITTAYKLYKDKDAKLGGARSVIMFVSNFNEIREDDYGRFALALLTANLFNREDEKIEVAMENGGSVSEGSIFEHVLEKGTATIAKVDGKNVRVTPHDFLVHLNQLVEYEGLDAKTFRNSIDVIIAAQRKGMKMINENHTSLQAAQYRLATIGVYQRLLANLFFDDDERANKYVHTAMNFQLGDDETDIRDDVGVQPNPFVSFLRNHGLLQDFLSSNLGFKKFIDIASDDFSYEQALIMAAEVKRFEQVYYSGSVETVNAFINS